jgi:hypothetical protein
VTQVVLVIFDEGVKDGRIIGIVGSGEEEVVLIRSAAGDLVARTGTGADVDDVIALIASESAVVNWASSFVSIILEGSIVVAGPTAV